MRLQVFGKCFTVALLGSSVSAQAASLTISPAVVTNDFVGKITLNITGLASARTVVVQRFADVNSNGVVDPGEPLMQSFTVRDGELPLIGGVRNLNVPGDEDGATNGQVRVELFFPDVDTTLGRFEGNYLYRISNPTNGFAPVAQPFTVRQKPYSQGIRGRITNASGGAPLTHATVVLLDATGKARSGTMINSNGYFTLQSAPGNYMLWAFQDGYVGDMTVGMAVVSSNQFATSNIPLVAGTSIVSGKVSDATTAAGLGGLMVFAQSTNNRYAIGFTDTNGSFVLRLTADAWNINCNQSQLPLLGYVGAQDGIQAYISGNVSNLNLQAPKANALVFGKITDEQGNPVIGAGLYANDSMNQFEADGITYPTSGAYCLGILVGDWQAGPDEDALGDLGFVGQGTNVSLVAGQALRLDFTLRHVTAHLRGRVLDEFGNAVDSIGLGANGPSVPWIGTQTDGSGNFDLGVTAGTWQLNLSSDDAQQRGLVSSDLSVTVTNGQTISNITYLVRHVTALITGNVSDDHGNPVSQLGVWAYTSVNGTNYNAYINTDNSGHYQLGVCNGSWTVGLDCDGLGVRGYACPSSQNVAVSGANRSQDFTVISSAVPLSATLQSPTLLPSGVFGFTVSGTPGRSFDIYASSDLKYWSLIHSTNSPSGVFQVSGPMPPGFPNLFFRAMVY